MLVAVRWKKEFQGKLRLCVYFKALGLVCLFHGTSVHHPGVEVFLGPMFLCLFHAGLGGLRGYEPPVQNLRYDTGTM